MPFPRWTFWKIIPIAHLGSWKNHLGSWKNHLGSWKNHLGSWKNAERGGEWIFFVGQE